MNILKFFQKKKEENLLVIKQKDVNSVPKVIYKGREIPYKQYIHFQWDTEEDDMSCGTKFDVQYLEPKEKGSYQITREGFSHPSQII